MDETKFNTLVQMIAALSARVEKLAQAQKNFVTKDDLKRFATKDDLKRFATKKDLERFATKEDLKKYATKKDLERFATKTREDLKRFATKDDLDTMAHTILTAIQTPFREQERITTDHERQLVRLEKTHTPLLQQD